MKQRQKKYRMKTEHIGIIGKELANLLSIAEKKLYVIGSQSPTSKHLPRMKSDLDFLLIADRRFRHGWKQLASSIAWLPSKISETEVDVIVVPPSEILKVKGAVPLTKLCRGAALVKTIERMS